MFNIKGRHMQLGMEHTTRLKRSKIMLVSHMLAFFICSTAYADNFQASWYSTASLKKEGTYAYSKGIMANGHRFDDNNLTCATRDYPLGSVLIVRNIRNDRSVRVVVTDRINKRFKGTRIDLSKKAFETIADLDLGVINVEVTVE